MTGISTILQVVKLKESMKKATITMPAMKSISTILQVESVRRAVLSYYPSGWSSRKRYEVFYNKGSSDPWMFDQEEEYQYLIGWQQAREACQRLGGDLAEPTDWEHELKILAGISKFPNGEYCKYCKYWIGIEKKTADAFWVSGEKMELDGSELKFASNSQWGNKTLQNMCGAIDLFGINDVHCDDGLLAGYVCEFANEAPICMDNLMANENPQ